MKNNLNNENRKIHDETNSRIYNRNIPSHTLQPYLDVRPVQTKYNLLSTTIEREKSNTKLNINPVYDQSKMFNPGNDKGSWSGYVSNINDESILRNQVYALQKDSRSVYVPNSNSDLYNNKFITTNKVEQPFEYLFKTEKYNDNNNSINSNNENQLFYNHSRVQILNNNNDLEKSKKK